MIKISQTLLNDAKIYVWVTKIKNLCLTIDLFDTITTRGPKPHPQKLK